MYKRKRENDNKYLNIYLKRGSKKKKKEKKEGREIITTEINVKRMLFSTSMKKVGVGNFRENRPVHKVSKKNDVDMPVNQFFSLMRQKVEGLSRIISAKRNLSFTYAGIKMMLVKKRKKIFPSLLDCDS